MLKEDTHRLVSNEGEIPFKNYLRINNEHLEACEVAKIIKETFKLWYFKGLILKWMGRMGGFYGTIIFKL